MPIVPVDDITDPALADYRDVKDRQLLEAFSAAQGVPRPPHPADPAPFGKLMAEGEVVFHVLVRSPCRVLSVLTTPTPLAPLGPPQAQLGEHVPIYVIDPRAMESLVGFPLHRGLMAIAARPAPTHIDDLLTRCTPGRPLLVLEDVFNHDNIGAAFRNCAALGGAGIILSSAAADPYYRKAVRVSAGHALRVPWARSDTAGPWPAALPRMQARGITVVAFTLSPDCQPLSDTLAADLRAKPCAILLGTEGPGLSPAAAAAADLRVVIPMSPGVDSLNVAVAGAVALHRLAAP
ncbi:MAG: TrmH family RNA methyltransferase [bacterium]